MHFTYYTIFIQCRKKEKIFLLYYSQRDNYHYFRVYLFRHFYILYIRTLKN